MNAIVTASNPRATSTSVVGGVDVDVIFSTDGGEHLVGTVTLAPSLDGRGFGSTWAQSPDEWVSRDLARGLTRLSWSDFQSALSEIEGEAAAVAEAL